MRNACDRQSGPAKNSLLPSAMAWWWEAEFIDIDSTMLYKKLGNPQEVRTCDCHLQKKTCIDPCKEL